MEAHTKPEVKARAVLEDLGNLSIDGVFESFNGEDMNSSDELNTARVVEVEDEFEVEEVRTVFSGRQSEEHNSYNGSEDEGEVEVDPAAEFLAKEQEELGDIGECFRQTIQQQCLNFLHIYRGGSWSSFSWWATT